MATENEESFVKVDPEKRVLRMVKNFLKCWTAFDNTFLSYLLSSYMFLYLPLKYFIITLAKGITIVSQWFVFLSDWVL